MSISIYKLPEQNDRRIHMIKKLKDKIVIIELIFAIAAAVALIGLSGPFWAEERLQTFLFNIGVDMMGLLGCAALIYGSMRQNGEGANAFRNLILLSDFSFIANAGICFTINAPEMRISCFILCLLNKLIDLVMIVLFYQYVRETLRFEGKLAEFTKKAIPVLMIAELIFESLNIFFPLTFYITEAGAYMPTDLSWTEDIFLLSAGLLTTILILKSSNPRIQKNAALMFIFLPILEYALTGGEFGNAGQYGVILISLIIMYCVIFNEKSQKLASTQVELNVATQIQADMLPSIFPAFPKRKEFDIYATMTPAKEVGGDFYDFFLIDDDHLAMVMADVSGKGVPAALFMVIAKTLIKNHAQLGEYSPSKVLMSANEQLCEGNKAELFVTVWLAILEISTGKGKAANAGHEHPALRRRDGKFELIEYRHSPAVATMEGIRFREHDFELHPGDSLFVYTDGVAEATDSHNELYGGERLIKALNKDPEASPKEMLANVKASVDEFVGEAPQFDDITMLGLKYFGAEDGVLGGEFGAV